MSLKEQNEKILNAASVIARNEEGIEWLELNRLSDGSPDHTFRNTIRVRPEHVWASGRPGSHVGTSAINAALDEAMDTIIERARYILMESTHEQSAIIKEASKEI